MKKHLSSFQIIILGFFGVILAGSLLLMLPLSSRSGEWTSFGDALFTATSSVCVTGLVVQDTGSYWSLFGQIMILGMIQVGGLGVITVAVSIAMLSGKKIGLMQRSTLQDAISAPTVGGIVRLTSFILKGVFAIELIGALCMAPVFCRTYGVWSGLWRSLFHSVSAFCNAGFDIMGSESAPFVSFTGQTGQPVLNVVLMLLIVIGGLGFLTWDDLKTHRHHWRRYRLQSKLIITVTAILILLPALFFYFYEFSGAQWAEYTTGEKIFASLFQSVTLRTAGFNSVDLPSLGSASQGLMIVFMLIGGAPGSTAGGMKVTTIAVLVLSAVSVFRRREDVTCFGRRLPADIVKNAAAILLLYLLLFLAGGLMISCIDGLPLSVCLFETASAVGTVGLSLGITASLSALSKLVLICLMFLGRVGGLTLVFAAFTGVRTFTAKLPQERVMVG